MKKSNVIATAIAVLMPVLPAFGFGAADGMPCSREAADGVRDTAAAAVIPDDPELIKGRLENGLTYYIRHNENPAGCADFYIIHNVGSLQEEDSQNGLAHFLEHMAFNGTRHYPDQEILSFLAKDGVRFGYNVNAYTNRTETVYNISSVPLVRESFVDSVLMILHDWSCDISCEPEALDAERGVISEEWRRKDEPRMRMSAKQNELIYKGSKHARRSVIGTLEVINGFKPHEILDFYHKWYRPDLQAIVVAGDFDAEQMESKVRKIFSDIPAHENPEPKGVYGIPSLQEPLFENMLDPQVSYHVLKVIHRQPFPRKEIRNTAAFYEDLYARQIVTYILGDRMREHSRRPGTPLSSAVLVTSPYSDDFYISLFTLSVKGVENLEEALAFYVEEVERMLRYGFTEDEFESAKFQVMKKYRLNMEDFPSEVTDRQIVDVCKENFLRGFSAANPYDMKQAQKMILAGMTYGDVKGYERKMFSDSEQIYSWCMNESDASLIPSPGRMKEIIAETAASDIRPEYLEYDKIDFSFSPVPGAILKTSPLKGTSSEIWTLSNGVKVIWTPAEPVNSNVHLDMRLYFDTGFNALPQDSIPASKFAAGYIARYLGFSGHDCMALKNSPECSGISTSVSSGQKFSTLSVNTDRKSSEKGFQMLYGMLTDPYFSADASLRKMKQGTLRSLGKTSNADIFKDDEKALRYGGHPWMADFDSTAVESVDMDFVRNVFRRSFGGGLSVYIASDMDRQEIVPLVEKYIASLPSSSVSVKHRISPAVPAYKGETVLDRSYDVETVPKSEVSYSFKGKTGMKPEDLACIDIMDYIMSARYMKQIREVRGGTYHVSFSTELEYQDGGIFESVVSFQTRPELVDVLVSDVEEVMADMAAEGPSERELDEAKKYLVKHHGEIQERNANSLKARNMEVSDFVRYSVVSDYDCDAVMENIGADDIRKFAARLAKGGRLVAIYREE